MAYPWTANDILTAADLNAAIGTGIVSTGLGAWTSYTPTWTSSGTAPAIGNGSLTGAYMKTGRRVDFRIGMAAGSTTTFGTGTYSWSLPVSGILPGYFIGLCAVLDVSVPTRFVRYALQATTTTIQGQDVSSASFIAQTSPMTWANGDSINIIGFYESAT